MQQNTTTTTILGLAATTAILLNGAAADFTIYLGNTNEIDNPGISFSAAGMQVHDHAPLDCSEVSDMVTISTPSDNDASSGGWACDGCNADAVRDWDVQRFEMYNGDDAVGSETDNPIPLFSSATGSVSTLYSSTFPSTPFVYLPGVVMSTSILSSTTCRGEKASNKW